MEHKGLHTFFEDGSCPDADTLLAYSRGELSGATLRGVEEHLSSCEFCSEALEGFLLLENPAQAEALLEELDTRFAQSKSIHSRPVATFRIAAILVFIVIAISALYVYLQQHDDGSMLSQQISKEEQKTPIVESYLEPEQPSSSEKSAASQPVTPQRVHEEKPVPQVIREQDVVSFAETKFAPPVTLDDKITDADLSINTHTGSANKDAQNIRASREMSLAKESADEMKEPAPKAEQTFSEIDARAKISNNESNVRRDVVVNEQTESISSKEYTLSAAKAKKDIDTDLREGLRLFNQKKYKEAIPFLQKAEKQKTTRDEAQWFLSRSFIATGDTLKGKSILEKIASSESRWKEDAGRLLKDLR